MGNDGIVYNYFKIFDSKGNIVGVGATERGSANEVSMVEEIFDVGYKLIKITKDEYDNFDGDEIINF